ncbi:MAG TPA: sulfide/dihydroorotate dehydrogenase-like FAD/NAD-binding protein, partial [Candidatus Omnitrophota bacterium]|nr:sulfide/dihydroorotate dehydrogenase-like FAD/NAD-binding protein [Candidatus Omnitrophota bacterium]
MFEIFNKQIIAQDIKRIDVYAPDIAQRVQPGQFVRVCPEEGSENIPLSVVDWDVKKGTISLIFQEEGDTTGKLGSLPIQESIFSVLGPLGVASKIDKKGIVVCLAT